MLGTDCGYTPAEIRAMHLDDARRLFRHWRSYPTTRALVAGFVGWKPPEPEQKHMTYDDFKSMLDHVGGKVPGLGRF